MKKLISLIALQIIVFASCKKTEAPAPIVPVLATITTTNASAITLTTATSGGNVTSDGGAEIAECGICYDTIANPTTSNNKLVSGTNIGSYTTVNGRKVSWALEMSGLIANKTYYIRAFANNIAGTAYGNQVTLKILKVDDIVCSGQGWQDAAPYNPTKPGIHPIIYYSNHLLLQEWQTSMISLVELVVCDVITSKTVQTCYYTGGRIIWRDTRQLDLTLREAKTGNIVATKTFYSSYPPSCPSTTYYSQTIVGEINYEEINNWLKAYVVK